MTAGFASSPEGFQAGGESLRLGKGDKGEGETSGLFTPTSILPPPRGEEGV